MAERDEMVWAVIERDPRIVERFWSNVRRDDSSDACWHWHGAVRASGAPYFTIGRWAVTPSRVAWYAATGEVARLGRLAPTCGSRTCVRPAHLGWLLSRAAEQRLLARGDGYVALSGVVEAYEPGQTNMPPTVRRIPTRVA